MQLKGSKRCETNGNQRNPVGPGDLRATDQTELWVRWVPFLWSSYDEHVFIQLRQTRKDTASPRREAVWGRAEARCTYTVSDMS